jgi:hypothetical protein
VANNATEKRDPLMITLVTCELILLIGIAICFAWTVSLQLNMDVSLTQHSGVSIEQFTKSMDDLNSNIERLQRVTRTQMLEQDED